MGDPNVADRAPDVRGDARTTALWTIDPGLLVINARLTVIWTVEHPSFADSTVYLAVAIIGRRLGRCLDGE